MQCYVWKMETHYLFYAPLTEEQCSSIHISVCGHIPYHVSEHISRHTHRDTNDTHAHKAWIRVSQ